MKSIAIIITMLFFVITSCSNETEDEKIKVKTNNLEHFVEKTLNRGEEAVCGTLKGDNKLECLAKKIKNRATETKDAVIDKGSEYKNEIDSN